jgi:hypothetical protein
MTEKNPLNTLSNCLEQVWSRAYAAYEHQVQLGHRPYTSIELGFGWGKNFQLGHLFLGSEYQQGQLPDLTVNGIPQRLSNLLEDLPDDLQELLTISFVSTETAGLFNHLSFEHRYTFILSDGSMSYSYREMQ